jgi:hypothetical protein
MIRLVSRRPACQPLAARRPSAVGRRRQAQVALGIDGIITDAVDRYSPGSSVHD